jgi:hypothetical protein
VLGNKFIFNMCGFVLVLLFGLVLCYDATRLGVFMNWVYILCFAHGLVCLGALLGCCVACWSCICL